MTNRCMACMPRVNRWEPCRVASVGQGAAFASRVALLAMRFDHENTLFFQWEFQDPKLEVPTIYKAYVRPMQGNIPTKYGLIWYSTVPPF